MALADSETADSTTRRIRPKWYRSTLYNALLLGICNFLAPGIWGAMNSLGAGGEAKPFLVNAANALTFCLMVVSCFFSSTIVKLVGVKYALIFGTLGYAPYAAGLYTNNRFGVEWLVLVGAALCGISAGIFWMAEAAIALSYPEPENLGKFLGGWLSFRVGGQILGGAINLGLDAQRSETGKVSYIVYLIFIAMQALAPFAGLLLNSPDKVQRTDGVKVDLKIHGSFTHEAKATAKLLFSRKFFFIVPFIAQGVYAEAVTFTFLSLWFSVRARSLGSFLSGILAIISGNLLGVFLDHNAITLKRRTRYAFFGIITLQGTLWIWATILNHEFRRIRPSYDWVDPGFGRGFTLYLFLTAGVQISYLYSFFVVGELASTPEEVVRIAGLLRGTQSASQAVSYGLNSLQSFAEIGGSSLNFGLWGISILPAWLIIRKIGTSLGDGKVGREKAFTDRHGAGESTAASSEKADEFT